MILIMHYLVISLYFRKSTILTGLLSGELKDFEKDSKRIARNFRIIDILFILVTTSALLVGLKLVLLEPLTLGLTVCLTAIIGLLAQIKFKKVFEQVMVAEG